MISAEDGSTPLCTPRDRPASRRGWRFGQPSCGSRRHAAVDRVPGRPRRGRPAASRGERGGQPSQGRRHAAVHRVPLRPPRVRPAAARRWRGGAPTNDRCPTAPTPAKPLLSRLLSPFAVTNSDVCYGNTGTRDGRARVVASPSGCPPPQPWPQGLGLFHCMWLLRTFPEEDC